MTDHEPAAPAVDDERPLVDDERPLVDDERPLVDDDGRPLVDALGLPCPRPVIDLATAVREVPVGAEVVLLADDPAADVDVPVWCRMQRQLLVAQERDGATLRFVVRKLREF